MNVNEEMMFGVLLVLMFGPDTGPLLLLYPQAMGPRSPRVRARSACLKTSLLDLLLCQLMPVDTCRPGSPDCGLRAFHSGLPLRAKTGHHRTSVTLLAPGLAGACWNPFWVYFWLKSARGRRSKKIAFFFYGQRADFWPFFTKSGPPKAQMS